MSVARRFAILTRVACAVGVLLLGLPGCSPEDVEVADAPAPPATPPPPAGALPAELAELEARPPWLFPADGCPADAMSEKPVRIRYLADGCRETPGTCLQRCRSGDGPDCYALALLVQEIEQEPDVSQALFLRSCELGIDSGCTNRAAGMTSRRVVEEITPAAEQCAATSFEKACDRGDAWACAMFGLHLSTGRGVPQDFERARAVLPGACVHGESDPACRAAHDLLRELEPPPDPAAS